ncbi:MAG: S-layer homology domain-containing protein [Firmicutes bacterium]|nr:S-layer homology domain-containing protein [Bacillota bacterium]
MPLIKQCKGKRKFRQIALPAIIFLLVFLLPISEIHASGFTDVEGDTASDVFTLSVLGIIDGYPDGTFRPHHGISRAEFAKITVTALGLENTLDLYATAPSHFIDVKTGDWYHKYVTAAVEQGILKGYPGGVFKPNAPLLATEALTMILRLLGYNDHLPGSWPHNYVLKAAELGLIDTKDFTNSTATRAFVATVLNKALDLQLVKWDNFFQGFFPAGKTLRKNFLHGEILREVKVFSTDNKHRRMIVISENENLETISLDVAGDVAILGDFSFAELKHHYVNCIIQNGTIKGIEILSTAVSGEVEAVSPYTRVVTVNGIDLVFNHSLNLPPKGKEITVYLYKDKVYLWQ